MECKEDVDIELNRTSSLSRQRGLGVNKHSINHETIKTSLVCR